MIAYCDLSAWPRAIFMIMTLALCMLTLYLLFSMFTLGLEAFKKIGCAALLILEYALIQVLYDVNINKASGGEVIDVINVFSAYSVIYIVGLILLFSVLNIWILVRIVKRRKTSLSPSSIKESMDSIPTGLCYCAENGTVLLANSQIEELCFNLTNERLLDSNSFWQDICIISYKRNGQGLQDTQTPIIIFDDGKVWQFEKTVLDSVQDKVFQIIAYDVTDLYAKKTELEQEEKKLVRMKKHLEKYNEMVFKMTIEEEILSAKIDIHERLGRALVTTRRFIELNDAEPQVELLNLWKHNVSLLRRSKTEIYQTDKMGEIERMALLSGVKVNFNGELPKDKKVLKLLKLAALECLNNAVRHANATEVFVSIKLEGLNYIFSFKNNGLLPKHDIKEGGGLMGLRHKVENLSGHMNVLNEPEFKLEISIPIEEM